MDILHTPCVPIIIVHTLFSCTHLHVEYHCEFEHSHALHTYRQPLCVQEDGIWNSHDMYIILSVKSCNS